MGCLFWILALSPLIYLIWKYLNKNYDYFSDRGIPHKKPVPIFGNWFGTMFLGKSLMDTLLGISNEFRYKKLYGMFDMTQPMYVIEDPDLIKQIGIKDFDHFVNHVPFVSADGDVLFSNSLFALFDEKWKNMRTTLSPAFTSSKMRMMYDLVRNCSETFIKFCNDNVDKDGCYEISVKDIFSKATVDVISTCAFGLEVDSLKNPTNDVYVNARKSFNFEDSYQQFKLTIISLFPKLAKTFNITMIPKEADKFFKQIVADTIQHRRKTNAFRPDVIQLLIQAMDGKLKHEAEHKENETGFAVVKEETSTTHTTSKTFSWTDFEIAAQCFLFFVAGFDTTSTTLTFATYELMIASDIQEKLYEEILETQKQLEGKPVTYEVVHKMEYMDAFVSEVLRRHPPGFLIDRVCNKDTKIKVNDREVVIPNQSKLWFNVFGMHHDHRYFPNPMKFDPTRFIGENKKNIIPNTYLPFGIGPRACIGSRFALMEVKLMLYHVLSEFSIEACEKTRIPLRYSGSFALAPEGELIVQLKKRSK